jgi:hypothetical protein
MTLWRTKTIGSVHKPSANCKRALGNSKSRWIRLLLAAFCCTVAACTSAEIETKANQAPAIVSAHESGPWLLIVPPLEGYSSDRLPQMGGPLALPSGWESRTGAGYRFVDVDRIDTNAPLDKWQKRHSYETQSECEDYRAAKRKEFSDPKIHHSIRASEAGSRCRSDLSAGTGGCLALRQQRTTEQPLNQRINHVGRG